MAKDAKSLEKQELNPESIGSAMVELAMRDDVDADKLEKLIDLQTKLEDRHANKELNKALANFQADCPIIKKTKQTHNSTYAPLDEIVHKIKPLMDRYGLSFSFSIRDSIEKERLIDVTIRHTAGGTYLSSYNFPAMDEGGKMNNSQRTRSANSYAKRTALENALGIVTANADDDASRAVDDPATEEQLSKINSLMKTTDTTEARLLNHLKIESLEMLSRVDAKKTINMLNQKRNVLISKEDKDV